MLTECPYCHIKFDVTVERLQRSSGSVRCDQCNTVFVASPVEPDPVPELEPTAHLEPVSIDSIELDNQAATIEKVELDDPTDALEDVEIEASDIDVPDMSASPTLETPELAPVEELHVNELELPEETSPIQIEEQIADTPASPLESSSSVQWSETNVHSLNVSNQRQAANADWLAEHEGASQQTDDSVMDTRETTPTTETRQQQPPVRSEVDEQSRPEVGDESTANKETTQPPGAGYDPRQLYPELDIAEPRPSASLSPRYLVASIVLIIVFVFQSIFLLHDELAKQTALRPYMQQFCEVLDCQIDLPSAPDAIVLRDREVRSHPNVAGALSVTANIENTALFTQHYPLLQLQFRDVAGQIVAGRNFQPDEYLPSDVNISAGMQPNKRVNVGLELSDPGEKAVSYLFIFK